MSCYICRREEFEKVLKAWTLQGEALHRLPYEDELKGAWLEIVGANYDAYNTRYPEHKLQPSEDLLTPPDLSWLIHTHFTKKERYDALKEYMYQVSDLDNYAHREAYYKCRWCLDTMLQDYIEQEFGED